MEHIDRLIAIAQDINMLSEAAQLSLVKQRLADANCELVLPLVGEFSAGKTTLINALTDSRCLETATKPTTATIYEIHFGSDRCYAEVYAEDGEKRVVDDLRQLKNGQLEDALVVNVFDTAQLIPSGIILVDTPGLSSPDARHRQTLVDFLPKADGVLLVVDVNQSITRSLTDFIQTMELARRPVFLVITQCDTKAPSAVEAQRQYMASNCKLPLERIACVSAKEGDVAQLCQLLDGVQGEKGRILEQVSQQRVKGIAQAMLAHLDTLLSASASDEALTEAIREKEAELRRINRNIDRLIESAQADIEELERTANRSFEDTVLERMDAIVASKSPNYNAEATAAINAVASICLNQFKTDVARLLAQRADDVSATSDAVGLQSLQAVDLSQLAVTGLSYDLDLDSIGHEYDSWIATGVKVAAAVATVAVVVGTGGAAAAGAAAAEAGTAMEVGAAVEMVDIASDIGSIVSNQRIVSRVQQAVQFAGRAGEQYGQIESMNQNAGQQLGQQKGIVEGLVGFVTDATWGKPQRRRAICLYLDSTLMPQFRRTMSDNSRQVVAAIADALHAEANVTLTEKKQALEQLRRQHLEQHAVYAQRLDTLREYKNEIITM